LDAPRLYALGAHAHSFGSAIDFGADFLDVWFEAALGAARDLGADAPYALAQTARGDLAADVGPFAADFTYSHLYNLS
jgi:hypothetical protein